MKFAHSLTNSHRRLTHEQTCSAKLIAKPGDQRYQQRDAKRFLRNVRKIRKGMTMKIDSRNFRVREGNEVDLKKLPTIVDPVCKSKRQYKKTLEKHVAQLSSLQRMHYASNRYAILLIFQAMDAAGKDGAIRHVMSGVNPQGCQVFSFKHPSPTELEHDFLWRTTRDLPERGTSYMPFDKTRPDPPAFVAWEDSICSCHP